jgi:hypothetical protein
MSNRLHTILTSLSVLGAIRFGWDIIGVSRKFA